MSPTLRCILEGLPLSTAVLAPIALHLVCIQQYGWFRDELYYVVCGEHLAWGYVDHPPFIAGVAWLVTRTLGSSLVAVRLANVLVGAVTALLTASIALRLGARPVGAAVAAWAVAGAPLYAFVFHHLNLNGFEVFFFTALARLLLDAVERPTLARWLGAGAFVGLGILDKYGMAFYLGALTLALVVSPSRRVLATPGPWLAAGLAALLVAPHVAWQVAHGFPSLEFMRNAATLKNRPTAPLDFVVAQVLLQHPVNAVLWLAGLGWLAFAGSHRERRWLPLAYLGFCGFFLLARAKPYYVSPVYPPLIAAGVAAFTEWLGSRRALAAGLASGHALGIFALLPMGLPLLPVDSFLAYQRAVGLAPPQMEQGRLGELPQHFADLFGWPELVAEVARVAARLPPDERARLAIVTESYGPAAAIDVLGREAGLPLASSGHNAYFLWGPRVREGDVVLVVASERWRAELEASFESVVVGGRTRCEHCLPSTNDLPLFVCRGWRRPLPELWARLRHYI